MCIYFSKQTAVPSLGLSARHGTTEFELCPWHESLTPSSQLLCAEGPAFVWLLNNTEPIWWGG